MADSRFLKRQTLAEAERKVADLQAQLDAAKQDGATDRSKSPAWVSEPGAKATDMKAVYTVCKSVEDFNTVAEHVGSKKRLSCCSLFCLRCPCTNYCCCIGIYLAYRMGTDLHLRFEAMYGLDHFDFYPGGCTCGNFCCAAPEMIWASIIEEYRQRFDEDMTPSPHSNANQGAIVQQPKTSAVGAKFTLTGRKGGGGGGFTVNPAYINETEETVTPSTVTTSSSSQGATIQASLERIGGSGILDQLAILGQYYKMPEASPGESLYADTPQELGNGSGDGARVMYDEETVAYEAAVRNKELYEQAAMNKLTPQQLKDRMERIISAMERHQGKYDELYANWREEQWIVRLDQVCELATIGCPQLSDQPNPWAAEGIEPTSKNYLDRIIKVFDGSDTSAECPISTVEAACEQIAATTNAKNGADAVVFKRGPTKRRSRAIEKVLNTDGRYDRIRDYGRGAFVVKKGHREVIADVAFAMASKKVDGFEMARIKNRFSPSYRAEKSAGYRDCQAVLMSKSGGWLVEIQIIPEEMLELKESLGHADYTEYRFVIEAANRSRAASESESAYLEVN